MFSMTCARAPYRLFRLPRAFHSCNQQRRKFRNFLNRSLAICLTALGWLALADDCSAQELEFFFSNGDVITAEVKERSLQWKTVDSDGSVRESTVLWNAVNQIVLTDSPASREAELVKQLLAQLEDPEYARREAAEKKLRDPMIGGLFRDLIDRQLPQAGPEGAIRIKRVIAELDEIDKKPQIRFDDLVLADGETLQGDAGDFSVQASYRGKETLIQRRDLLLVKKPSPDQRTPPDRQGAQNNVEVELFYQPDQKQFYRDDQAIIDFNETPSGDELNNPESIRTTFLSKGILFGTEQRKGDVVISRFKFNSFSKMPRDNSIAIYENLPAATKRFKGVMTFDFCLPNQSSSRAGVTEFGLFIARVEAGRDFVLEGYNELGDLVVNLEAPNDPCGFMGFRSTTPISHIRLLSNPNLFRIDRTIDVDFGVDHVCYSAPIPVLDRPQPLDLIRLRNGDLLGGTGLTLEGDSIDLVNQLLGKLTFPREEVDSVSFAQRNRAQNQSPRQTISLADKQWLVMLNDGSQLHVQPGKLFTPTLFQRSFSPEEVAALRCNLTPLRYPIKGDLDDQQPVIVYPTCRIVPNKLEFLESGFRWNADAKKRLQPVDKRDPLGKPGVDPTPTIQEVNFETTTPEDLPTIWFRKPVEIGSTRGMIQLRDGQSLAFGNNNQANFRLIKLTQDQLQLEGFESSFSIAISEVVSIRWPTQR